MLNHFGPRAKAFNALLLPGSNWTFRFTQSFLPALLLYSLPWLLGVSVTRTTRAQDLAEARSAFYQGDYEACIKLTQTQVEKGIWNDFWSRQLMRALLETGRYEEARDTYKSVAEKFSNSIDLRVLGATAYRYCGEAEVGNRLLDEIPELISKAPWRYSDRENLLAVGKYLLEEGEDARYILESCFDRILKSDPSYVDAYIAVAELALSKADSQEAVSALAKALELRPEDPQVSYLLAQAWSSSDSSKSTTYLKAALDINPWHIPSLILQASELIDGEQYDAAETVLQEVLDVNEHCPQAWALKAAIAHLRGEYLEEGKFRSRGLARWSTNPEVDFLAGETLSRHYRFEESVKYQQRALRLDPEFLPAQFQLAQDLLRTGRDNEGWQMVQQVAEQDKYNVVAYNLRTLHEQILKFETLRAPGLIVRMDTREAEIYGAEVLDLLTEARETLSEKYDFELEKPTTVEIFPQQSDFAIRTFGLPGGAGYLGVCFGTLITANSPASQGESPSNWKSVLWHEFCHVITLQKTNNRMPRWLSEGLSVYEEIQRDASWGQSMDPQYRQMLLGEDFVPLSELSSAFLNAKSPLYLQFAYFESYLAVQYLIERHGQPLMLKLLEDLGMGVSLQDAFARRYGDREKLDADFASYVRDMAREFNPETEFSAKDIPPRMGREQLQEMAAKSPKNYVLQVKYGQALIESEQWQLAREQAEKLLELYPSDTSSTGGLGVLAKVARETGNDIEERKALETIVTYSPDNVAAMLRLIELAEAAEDWGALLQHSEQLLAVNPLIAVGHTSKARAAFETERFDAALQPLQALQEMDPLDPAGLRYRLAYCLLQVSTAEQDRTAEAREQVLLALEHSPRYRAAQVLLQEIAAIREGEMVLPSLRDAGTAEEATPQRTSSEPSAAVEDASSSVKAGAASPTEEASRGEGQTPSESAPPTSALEVLPADPGRPPSPQTPKAL